MKCSGNGEDLREIYLPQTNRTCYKREIPKPDKAMLTRSQIIPMIEQPEGPLLERKPSRVNAREIRQTVVAFANSVSGTDEAVLLIGIGDRGVVHGCTNAEADAIQKSVRDVCEKQCYPAIAFRVEVLSERQNVVAVVIPPSGNRPHFAGQAYVRRGSESVAASDEVFNELVYSRNSKAGMLLEYKKRHMMLRVTGLGNRPSDFRFEADNRQREFMQCKVFECNAQYVRFERIDGTGGRFSAPLENITITHNEEKWCPELIVRGY